jgi:WD40 repeat protein
VQGDGCKSLASLLGDAYQFISKFKSVIEVAPLQVYYVGARFTPERSSALRAIFADLDSTWDVKPDIPMHWDLYSLSIEGHTQAIRDIAFSPDGQMLASIAHDKSLRLWSLTGDQLSLGLHRDYISALGFCENGKQVVSVTMTGHVQFWEVATGRRLWDFHLSGLTPGSRVRSVAISPHGSIAWRHDSAMIWKCDRMGRDVQLVSHLEAKANTEEANSSDVEVETEIGFTVICTSPDGRLVAGTSDGQLFMWNPGWSGQPCQWKGHSSWVLHIAFSTEGHLATYATGDKICIWTWSGGEMSCIWQKSVAHIHGMAFAPNAQLVFAENRTTQQWDPRADQQIGKPIDHASSVIAIAVSTTDQLASATSDNIIRLWPNSSRNGAGDEQDLQYSEVTVCIFSDDGNFLVSGHENGEVRTWDSLTGKELRLLTSADQSLAGDIRSLAVSPDGSSIVSGSRNKILRWWVTSKEKEFHRRHEFFERAVAMTFSTDGAVLALGLGGGFIYLQNGAHDETPRLFASGTDPIESLLFAGDGMSLVSGHFGSAVCLWCVKTGTLLHRFQPNGQQMTTVAISCNGVIACVTEQGWPVQLWDASSKELLLELSAGASVASPRQLEFSADGSILRTNVGDFDLIHAPSTAMSCSALRPAPLRLNADGNWIQRFGEDELWLPPGWRLGHGWFFTFAVRYGATLAIPTATRGMIFWREKSSLSVTESQV